MSIATRFKAQFAALAEAKGASFSDKPKDLAVMLRAYSKDAEAQLSVREQQLRDQMAVLEKFLDASEEDEKADSKASDAQRAKFRPLFDYVDYALTSADTDAVSEIAAELPQLPPDIIIAKSRRKVSDALDGLKAELRDTLDAKAKLAVIPAVVQKLERMR